MSLDCCWESHTTHTTEALSETPKNLFTLPFNSIFGISPFRLDWLALGQTSQIASSPTLLFFLGPREKNGSNVAAESPNLGGASQALILKRSCKGWMRNESHAKIVWGNRDFLSFLFGPLDCILERHNFGEPIIRWDWYGTAAHTQLQSSMWIIHAAEGNWAMLLINWQFWASYAKSYLNDLKKMIREGYRIWNMQPETTAPLWTASF